MACCTWISADEQDGEREEDECECEYEKYLKSQKRKEKSEKIDNATKGGEDIDEIKKLVTPSGLSDCLPNILEKSLKVSYKLRNAPDGPHQEELVSHGDIVEDFACRLLKYSNKDISTKTFGFNRCIDRITNVAIRYEAKKFLSCSMTHDFLRRLWTTRYFRKKGASPSWVFRNAWALLDLFLFPIVFLLLFIYHHIDKRRWKRPELNNSIKCLPQRLQDELFKDLSIGSIRALGKSLDIDKTQREKFKTGKDILDFLLKTKGFTIEELVQDLNEINCFDFDLIHKYSKDFLVMDLPKDLKNKLRDKFEDLSKESRSTLVLNSLHSDQRDLKEFMKGLTKGFTIKNLAQGFKQIDQFDREALIYKCTEDIYEQYKKYFETPYFIFLRDSLSYLALLLLHCVVCVQPTGLRFSVLEWIIMVFFIGRIFMEIDQFISEKKEQEKYEFGGLKYTNDFWNKLDMATITIYVAIITVRVATWSSTPFISHNLLIVTASYLYGINAMLLTLRVFGQAMEIKQSTGTKQIALIRIIGAVAVIFVQMVAAILGFSLILTKIYVAEVSYNAMANVSVSHGVCLTSDGISCWWHMFEFLAWSAMGSGDPDLLTLTNDVSNYVTKVLYMMFLIIAAVMIMNMLIALLSNTYQQVEDNAFHEWSYNKAILIKTYCNYHPVPVPFNIISLSIKLFRALCSSNKYAPKFLKLRKSRESGEKLLDEFCKRLQAKYFAEYGDSFPLQESKTQKLLHENRRLMGHIAGEVFRKELKSSGSSEWECSDGIKEEDGRLCHFKCKKCKTIEASQYCVHGARHQVSLSRDWPGFEVLIQHCGKRRYVGIGVASKNYHLEDFPGWEDESVGYHVDTGTIFDCDDQLYGNKGEDSMAYAGDLIGCIVLFDKEKDNILPVQFIRNGRTVGVAKIDAQLIGNLHPFVAMAYSGINLLFRLIRNAESDSTKRNYSTQAIDQLQQELARATQQLQDISDKVTQLLENSQDDDTNAASSKRNRLVSRV